MAINYRTSGAWGAGIGQDLTASQVDNNFYDLATRLNGLETNPPEPVSIEEITATATTLTIQLSDGTTQGPFKMPVATFNYRGLWTPATAYAINDVVSDLTGAAYVVKVAHTSSGASFNSALTIGSVAAFMQLTPAANTLTYEGEWQPATPYVRGNFVRVNGIGAYFVNIEHTSQGAFNDEYQIGGNNVYELILQEAYPSTPVLYIDLAQTITLSPAHLGKFIVFDDVGFLSVVVPALSNVDWPIGGEVHFYQYNADPNKIVINENASTAFINYPNTYSPSTRQFGATMTLKKITDDSFAVFGLLAD